MTGVFKAEDCEEELRKVRRGESQGRFRYFTYLPTSERECTLFAEGAGPDGAGPTGAGWPRMEEKPTAISMDIECEGVTKKKSV